MILVLNHGDAEARRDEFGVGRGEKQHTKARKTRKHERFRARSGSVSPARICLMVLWAPRTPDARSPRVRQKNKPPDARAAGGTDPRSDPFVLSCFRVLHLKPIRPGSPSVPTLRASAPPWFTIKRSSHDVRFHREVLGEAEAVEEGCGFLVAGFHALPEFALVVAAGEGGGILL